MDKQKKPTKRITGYQVWLIQALREPEQAIAYAQVAIDEYRIDEDMDAFLHALELVISAQCSEQK